MPKILTANDLCKDSFRHWSANGSVTFVAGEGAALKSGSDEIGWLVVYRVLG
jgi:hypothetical protein